MKIFCDLSKSDNTNLISLVRFVDDERATRGIVEIVFDEEKDRVIFDYRNPHAVVNRATLYGASGFIQIDDESTRTKNFRRFHLDVSDFLSTFGIFFGGIEPKAEAAFEIGFKNDPNAGTLVASGNNATAITKISVAKNAAPFVCWNNEFETEANASKLIESIEFCGELISLRTSSVWLLFGDEDTKSTDESFESSFVVFPTDYSSAFAGWKTKIVATTGVPPARYEYALSVQSFRALRTYLSRCDSKKETIYIGVAHRTRQDAQIVFSNRSGSLLYLFASTNERTIREPSGVTEKTAVVSQVELFEALKTLDCTDRTSFRQIELRSDFFGGDSPILYVATTGGNASVALEDFVCSDANYKELYPFDRTFALLKNISAEDERGEVAFSTIPTNGEENYFDERNANKTRAVKCVAVGRAALYVADYF